MVPPHLKHRMNVNREAALLPPKESLQSSRETTSDHPQDLAVIPYDAVKAGEKDAGKASANNTETESHNLKVMFLC